MNDLIESYVNGNIDHVKSELKTRGLNHYDFRKAYLNHLDKYNLHYTLYDLQLLNERFK